MYLALLSYRTTPLPFCNLSPAELVMGRRLRSNLPQLEGDLTPEWPDLEELRRRDEQLKQKQKQDFDRRHKTAPLPDIPEKTDVWVTSGPQVSGQVTNATNHARSYVVETHHGRIRRNQRHPTVLPRINGSFELSFSRRCSVKLTYMFQYGCHFPPGSSLHRNYYRSS